MRASLASLFRLAVKDSPMQLRKKKKEKDIYLAQKQQ